MNYSAKVKNLLNKLIPKKELKRKIVTFFFILLIFASPIAYLTLQNSSKAYSWYNSSWQYRKPVTVGNTGGTQTNYDVLIVLDTAALISASKLQSDCDDIRLVDSDDTTLISYWIEAGCNTTTTQIWTRVPSLAAGGETIYLYYGNVSATNAQQSWSGSYTLMYNTTCPAGWTRNTAFDARFPQGSTGSTQGGVDSHGHNQLSGTSGASLSNVNYNASGSLRSYSGHTHTNVTADVSSTTIIPPYLHMVFCTKNEISVASGLIANYDTTTPAGWTRFTALDNRYPRGSATYGGTGGASTHTHPLAGGYATGTTDNSVANVWVGTVCDTGSVQSHNHTSVNGTSGSGTNTPPYLDMVFASANSATTAPTGMISIVSAVPPLGWTRFSALDSKFPRGAASYGGTGGTTTHLHSATVSTNGSGGAGNPVCSGGNVAVAVAGHGHSRTSNTNSVSNLPSYQNAIYAKKNNPSAAGVTSSVGSEETDFPQPPTIGTPIPLSTTSIRWTFTDNATSETGFRVYDMSGVLKVTCVGANLTYCDETGLSSNTQYTRQLKAYNANGESTTYSGSASAYTLLTSPVYISPSDNASGVTYPVTFTFSTTDSNASYLRYKIDICENREMTLFCRIVDQTVSQTGWSGQNAQTSTAYTSGTTATFTSSNFSYGHRYYWRIYAIAPAESNTWTTALSPISFTTNALSRSSVQEPLTIFSGKREAEFPSTTNGWAAVTGTNDSNTTASTNGWIDSANLVPGRRYLILASGSHSTDSVSGKSGLRVLHGATSFTESESVDLTTETNASYKTPYFWFTVWTAVTNEDLEVQLYWNNTGTQARAEDITLMAIEAEDLITSNYLKYSLNTTNTALTSTLANTETLTFTPASSNNTWWIMGYNKTNLTTGSGAKVENVIKVGSTTFANNLMSINSSSINPVLSLGNVQSLTNTSQTISLQAREYSIDQSVTASGIFALNISRLEDRIASYQTSGTSVTTPGAWVNQFTVNPLNSINNSEWIVVAGANINDASTRTIGRLVENITSITDDTGGWMNASGDKTSLILLDYYQNLSSGFKTFKFDTQSTLAGTGLIEYPWMVAFSTEMYPFTNMQLPADNDMSEPVRTPIKMTSIDPDGDTIQYKFDICTDEAMTTGCNTYDQTASQTGWSGQNAVGNTQYTSGTQATYTPQSDLTIGQTYYWRAYSKDPSGTNTWTAQNTNPNQFTISSGPSAAQSLWVEGSSEPTGVQDITPEFSAIFSDPYGEGATAYEIEVNTQADFAGTVMWDTGKQSVTIANNTRSSDTSYSGSPLDLIGTQYFWRIRFWNDSNVVGSWANSNFTMYIAPVPTSCYLVKNPESTQLEVKWKDNSSIEDGYRVQRKTNGGSWLNLTVKPANAISHTDSTISVNNTYQYRVAPTLSTSNGGWCTTDIASVMIGSIKFEGLNLGGIQIR